jgi:hypothetical protein
MSSRVGTLQAPKIGRSIWPAAFLAALVVLTMATVAVSFGREEGAPTAPGITTEVTSGIADGSIGSTLANTPSELSGGIVGGRALTTAANTPTELSGGIVGGIVPPQDPPELTAAERYDLHQRI